MTNVDWPPKFTLDQENILNLLTGDRFYSDPSAALREAVLNAIDAVNRRRLKEQDLDPKIEVLFNQQESRLEVIDNGIGMNQQHITSLFAKVGASAAELDSEKKSVGEFGIGVASYFMAGDEFEVHTFDGQGARIALLFSKAMLAGGAALELDPLQELRGTKIIIKVRNESTFDILHNSYKHWCRDVTGLSAKLLPDNTFIEQGGTSQVSCDLPASIIPMWVEKSNLSPVDDPTSWESMTGHSKISILYRGVFVQEFEIEGLWGIKGSVDVDPKRFAPRLNRESFVGGEFQSEVNSYARSCHPYILKGMIHKLNAAVSKGTLSKWTEKRWANLWLSVPRADNYKEVVAEWDEVFRKLPAFDYAEGNSWVGISVEDLIAKATNGDIYLAPFAEEKSSDVIKAAVHFLRTTGKTVIRGIRKDKSWIRFAPAAYSTTADLIINRFQGELPTFKYISKVADNVLSNIKILAPLFTGPPKVDLVKLGFESPPALRVSDRLILNIDNKDGLEIVKYVLDYNQGQMSLLAITARLAIQQLNEVAAVVKKSSELPETLSPVRRRFIRRQLP